MTKIIKLQALTSLYLLGGCASTTTYHCLGGEEIIVEDKEENLIVEGLEVEKGTASHKLFLTFCKPSK